MNITYWEKIRNNRDITIEEVIRRFETEKETLLKEIIMIGENDSIRRVVLKCDKK